MFIAAKPDEPGPPTARRVVYVNDLVPTTKQTRTRIEEDCTEFWLRARVDLRECECSRTDRGIVIVEWNLEESARDLGLGDDGIVTLSPLNVRILFQTPLRHVQ